MMRLATLEGKQKQVNTSEINIPRKCTGLFFEGFTPQGQRCSFPPQEKALGFTNLQQLWATLAPLLPEVPGSFEAVP